MIIDHSKTHNIFTFTQHNNIFFATLYISIIFLVFAVQLLRVNSSSDRFQWCLIIFSFFSNCSQQQWNCASTKWNSRNFRIKMIVLCLLKHLLKLIMIQLHYLVMRQIMQYTPMYTITDFKLLQNTVIIMISNQVFVHNRIYTQLQDESDTSWRSLW